MVNTAGKRMHYFSALESELLNVESLYPKYKRPFQFAQRLGALAFYRDSYSDPSPHCEIGRLSDTKEHKQEGHVQSMDIGNWTPIANDCWLLGALHSMKVIRLRTTNSNAVWDPSRPGTGSSAYAFPVTRRELTGILEFGFEPVSKTGSCITFESTRPQDAIHATLSDYAKTTTLAMRNSKKVHDFIGEWMDIPDEGDEYWS